MEELRVEDTDEDEDTDVNCLLPEANVTAFIDFA